MNDKDTEKKEEAKAEESKEEQTPVEEKAEEVTEAPAAEAKADKPAEEKKEEADEATAEEKKEEEQPETSDQEPDTSVEVPEEFKNIIEKIEKMTVMELHALVKFLEKKFGVSAQAVAVSGPAASSDAAEEKSSFNVELKSVGDSKINVIKAVKAILGLGLKEAKDLVEAAPAVLKEGVKKEEAEEMKKAIEEAGGQVELK